MGEVALIVRPPPKHPALSVTYPPNLPQLHCSTHSHREPDHRGSGRHADCGAEQPAGLARRERHGDG